MQKHEGPSDRHGTAERDRQRAITKRLLLLAIVVVGGALAAVLVERWT